MSLNLEDKKEVVAEISARLAKAQAVVLAEYRGLPVEAITVLRARARSNGVYLRVLKNTLARRAVQGTPFEKLSDQMVGPLAYGISDDPVAAAKVLHAYAKENDKLVIKGGAMPNYVFITPNLVNDMHDGSISQGDTWLANEVPKILASSAYQNGGALFVLWDEGSSQGDDPPFMVVSPHARAGFVSQVEYDTSAFLKTTQAMLGVEALPCATDPAIVPVMSDLFTAPMP